MIIYNLYFIKLVFLVIQLLMFTSKIMFKSNLLIYSNILLIIGTVQNSYGKLKWNQPSDLIDDAHEQLEKFKQVTNNSFTKALEQYRNVSKELDSVALATKGKGIIKIKKISQKLISEICENNIQIDKKCVRLNEVKLITFSKIVTNDLINCVNEKANSTLNFVSSAIIKLLAFAVDQNNEERKAVIVCGKNDEKCLNRTVAGIKTNIALMPGAIRSLALIDELDVEDRISSIKDCADQSFLKMENLERSVFDNI